MIKKFKTYIKESIENNDPYDEEIWDDETFIHGDIVICIKDSMNSKELNNPLLIKKGDIKKIKDSQCGFCWFTTTPYGWGYYQKKDFKKFNLNTFMIEGKDYDNLEYEEEPDYDDSDILSNLRGYEIKRNMKVQCIEDCVNDSQFHLLPCKKGDIKIVKDSIGMIVWFEDTPVGWGAYPKQNFIRI